MGMLIRDSFKKDINRAIDPVVKADADEHLADELDEFVVTNEIKQHLYDFFDEYDDSGSASNGAWISGFFGSGKSHLLKILAVMMEDRQVGGTGAMERMLPKFDDEPALKAKIENSRKLHPSESVLFNIDSYAPNNGQAESGALLAAFIKALNHHCGYFDGGQMHIAALEYDLDREGRLGIFRDVIARRCGKSWEDIRKAALIHDADISRAFDEACGNAEGTTQGVIRYYRETYKPDIRGFAGRVSDYIDVKGKGFRLNFFVDEVGQFIAQNTGLMVNLQSIAEELNSRCGGDSWIVVTSQEDINGIVGQLDSSSANDFSKIQGRFGVKMPLSSSDAREVICDRLLAKTDESEDAYLSLYERYKDDFGVLFDFTDGVRRFRGYQGVDDFERIYPFVPYQFDVFSSAMRGLSDQNAFSGRHNSTGARSMLGVFQVVAQNLCDKGASTERGTLASFDMMFEGIRTTLRTEAYAAISQAEDNLDDETAVRALEALLLVKYCPEIKATATNVRVLLYGAFTENVVELDQKVREALDELERQVYVRREDNCYEYLTDEEKDVENEIRATEVKESESRKLVGELFRDAVGQLKVTYRNGDFEHTYAYNLKVDGEAQGQQRNDLSLNVVTWHERGNLHDIAETAPRTLTVDLVDPGAFLKDVRRYLQTERYANLSSGAGKSRERIISEKRMANAALRGRLAKSMEEMLGHARYYAGATEVTSQVGGSGASAVSAGALELVKRTYTGLQQLGERLTDNDVYRQAISRTPAEPLPEYCGTVLSRIGLASSAGPVTVAGDGMGSLASYFSKNDYGWPDVAVRSAVARLYAAGMVEARRAGTPVEGTDLADALSGRRELDRLCVAKVRSVSAEDLSRLQAAFRTVTGVSPGTSDAKDIAQELSEHANDIASSAEGAVDVARQLPFSAHFAECLQDMRKLAQDSASDWAWVVSDFPGEADGYHAVEADLTRMSEFAKGSPVCRRWQHLRDFLAGDARAAEELGIGTDVIAAAREAVEDEDCYKSGRIPPAAAAADELSRQVADRVDSLRDEATKQLDETRSSYMGTYHVGSLDGDARARFGGVFSEAEDKLKTLSSPSAIRGFIDRFKGEETPEILAIVRPSPAPARDDASASKPPAGRKAIPVASLRQRRFGKPVIEDERDVDEYLDGLREAILEAIHDGNVVTS
jgi:DNA-binding transcriptional ArsR family regulator